MFEVRDEDIYVHINTTLNLIWCFHHCPWPNIA